MEQKSREMGCVPLVPPCPLPGMDVPLYPGSAEYMIEVAPASERGCGSRFQAAQVQALSGTGFWYRPVSVLVIWGGGAEAGWAGGWTCGLLPQLELFATPGGVHCWIEMFSAGRFCANPASLWLALLQNASSPAWRTELCSVPGASQAGPDPSAICLIESVVLGG